MKSAPPFLKLWATLSILIWAEGEGFHAYVRQVSEQTLEYKVEGDFLVDLQTRLKWDIVCGRALEGSLKGEALRSVPSSTAFDCAWQGSYPQTTFYKPW